MKIRAGLAFFLALGIFRSSSPGTFMAAGGENSIVYLRLADATHLDPWQAREFYSTEIVGNIFEGLVRFKKNSSAIEPCLATAWRVEAEGRRWLFDLRRGVRFHDRTPFDSRAVIDSFQGRLEKKEGLSSLFSFISAVRGIGPYAVEITLKQPYAPFLAALADSTAFIVSGSASKKGDFKPIGTGPFRFLSWSRGKTLILGRNPGYWGGAPLLDRIIFKVMPDSQGRLLQIKSGSADMVKIQSGKEYEELARRSDIAILSTACISTHYLGFNTRKPPFDRQEVRAAFLHTIDKGTLIKQVFQNLAEPAFSPLPQALIPGMKVQSVSSFNPEVARRLLKRAGLENGFRCTLYLPMGQPGAREVADILVAMARRIKIAIRKVELPFDRLIEAAERGEHDILFLGWSTIPDPDFFLYPLFTLSPGNRNRFFYENPELTRLLDKGRIAMVPAERRRIYLQSLAILNMDVPWIPLYHPLTVIASRKTISGLSFTPLGHALFREAAKAAE